ncbi:MAG: hypothetical protein GY716_21170 [bacterium]|nr:hypothetical protein [bacterium]
MTFTVSLSNASYLEVSADFTTADGDAMVSDNDYFASSGSAGGGDALTIPAGDTSGELDVTIIGDTNTESNEAFTMTLSNVANATPTPVVGTGTILDDGDTGIFALPSPTINGFHSNDEMHWTAVVGTTSYHMYRGDLAALKASGVYSQDSETVTQAERSCWVSGTSISDSHAPGPGVVLFYLITADDGSLESSLGHSGSGTFRPHHHPCR